jgi:hypothetical protein
MRILEIPRWVMAQNWLRTTDLDLGLFMSMINSYSTILMRKKDIDVVEVKDIFPLWNPIEPLSRFSLF